MSQSTDKAPPTVGSRRSGDREQDLEILRDWVLWQLIDLDLVPVRAPRPRRHWDNALGLAICVPLYGYGLYKLFGG